MDDYKKIPFDDPDLCVPDLDDFDQMKEFFLDCAAEYFRYLSSDVKVADSRRNRLAQDRDRPRNITPRYDDDNRDSQ